MTLRIRQAALLSGVLLLTGCQMQAGPVIEPAPTAMTEEPQASFWEIADASCQLAMEKGVVEQGSGFAQFMVPKSEGIDGYSAGYWEIDSDTVGLIWEADSLVACGASISKAMAEEAGQSLDWEIAELGNGEFDVTQQYPDFDPVTVRYVTQDGLIVSTYLPEEVDSVFDIEYGSVPEKYLELLRRAIEEFNNG